MTVTGERVGVVEVVWRDPWSPACYVDLVEVIGGVPRSYNSPVVAENVFRRYSEMPLPGALSRVLATTFRYAHSEGMATAAQGRAHDDRVSGFGAGQAGW